LGIYAQSQSFSSLDHHNDHRVYPLLKSDQLASEIISETFAIPKESLIY
jgi:hypothetical protein